jgi:uncharacterized membrane protein YcaP (DUF421 family)
VSDLGGEWGEKWQTTIAKGKLNTHNLQEVQIRKPSKVKHLTKRGERDTSKLSYVVVAKYRSKHS